MVFALILTDIPLQHTWREGGRGVENGVQLEWVSGGRGGGIGEEINCQAVTNTLV